VSIRRNVTAWFGRLHLRFKTPVCSILCMGLTAFGLTIFGNQTPHANRRHRFHRSAQLGDVEHKTRALLGPVSQHLSGVAAKLVAERIAEQERSGQKQRRASSQDKTLGLYDSFANRVTNESSKTGSANTALNAFLVEFYGPG
jgi:hypothetical protein